MRLSWDFFIKDLHTWDVTDKIKLFVERLKCDNSISSETKIIKLYEKMSEEYVYDDNLISFIKKVKDGVYEVPDAYGRKIDEVWINNRKNHNRRVCYELAREFAGALTTLFRDNNA